MELKPNRVILLAAAALLVAPSIAGGFDEFHGAVAVHSPDYDSLFALAVPLDESAEGRALVDRCLARYGGVEKLEALGAFRLAYRAKTFLARDSLDVIRSFASGRRHSIHRKSATANKRRVLNRSDAWFDDGDTLIVLDDGRYKAELFSYLTLAMPLAITTERFDSIRYGTRDGDPVGYIYMTKNDSLMIVTGIDPADSLIKSSEGVIRQGEKGFTFINRFSDHEEHGGYWFPGKRVNISLGLEVSRSVLSSVEIAPAFAEDEFQPRREGKR